jgi:hypothetical protein
MGATMKAEKVHFGKAITLKFSDYVAISADYGKLLVTNLMLINAGALLVFPSLLQVLKHDQINLISASFAASLFVVGLVLAGLCGYVAYLNFMWLGLSSEHTQNLRDFKSKCTPDMFQHEANKVEIAKMENSIRRNDCAGSISIYLGNLFGLASGVVFCFGCYYVRQSILF